jgi:peroxiredoxin
VIVLLVGFQVWFSLQLLSQNGRLLGRFEELERTVADLRAKLTSGGEPPAPSFALPGTDGRTHTLESLVRKGRRLMLVFSDADCGPCGALMPELAEWQRTYELGFVVIAGGDAERNRAKTSEHGLDRVLLDEGREVAESFGARLTPAAVVVGTDGLIERPAVFGADAIRALLGPPRDDRVGRPAPDLELPDLDGRRSDLSALYGDRTLAIFWNPECGFCQQMLPDVRALELDPPPGAPDLLIISAGTPEQVRAQGLRSQVVLDPDSAAMRAFAASGTPMGVLVEDGRIASPVAAGSTAVLQLAGLGRVPEIVHVS